MKKYDLIVLGGGTAGMNLAFPLSADGYKVALVESDRLGGTCINVGCIPSKTLISSGRAMQTVRDAAALGVLASAPRADWPAMVGRKEELTARIRGRGYQNVQNNDRITLYEGRAAFAAPDRVEVGGEVLTADKIVIATGARTYIPPLAGLEDSGYLTSTSVMEMPALPASLLILGGGIIALEFSQLFARLGVKVTILQRGERLALNLDPDFSEEIRRILEKDGVRVVTGTGIDQVSTEGGLVYAGSAPGGAQKRYSAEKLLVATGRRPNSDLLALDKAGVETDDRGYIIVDEGFKTSAENIWALGDVTGGMMFTHRAWHDAFLLSRYFTSGKKIESAGRLIPFAIFTEPEIAAVGLDLQAAEAKGYRVKAHTYPFRFQGRALAMGKTDGFIKMTVEENSGRILGAYMIGPEAGELIHELITAIYFKATVDDIRNMIHVHPTLSEAIINTANAG